MIVVRKDSLKFLSVDYYCPTDYSMGGIENPSDEIVKSNFLCVFLF